MIEPISPLHLHMPKSRNIALPFSDTEPLREAAVALGASRLRTGDRLRDAPSPMRDIR